MRYPQRQPAWRKSSYCLRETCVEAAVAESGILLRNSSNPGTAPLIFPQATWANFLHGLRSGEFGR
ncbi:DUF397 domain-containing protein [Cryptosporangium sp. NPDC048952]|uniref:DUF397 domain-containing protein n=1 Tax=Cryptosporangium sp. NPDC048952 TaxID=3363961 RepID=UPI0037223C3D